MHFQNDRNHGNSKKHPKIVHNHFHEKTINVLEKKKRMIVHKKKGMFLMIVSSR